MFNFLLITLAIYPTPKNILYFLKKNMANNK
jgi:hypothetical protein